MRTIKKLCLKAANTWLCGRPCYTHKPWQDGTPNKQLDYILVPRSLHAESQVPNARKIGESDHFPTKCIISGDRVDAQRTDTVPRLTGWRLDGKDSEHAFATKIVEELSLQDLAPGTMPTTNITHIQSVVENISKGMPFTTAQSRHREVNTKPDALRAVEVQCKEYVSRSGNSDVPGKAK